MSNFNELAKIENSRNCLRRIARHDDQEFSNQSIINVIEKFIKTVNSMEETILLPSKLMDRQVGDESDPMTQQKSPHSRKRKESIRDQLVNTDLFNLYTMLQNLKLDLLWSRNGPEPDSPEPSEDELPEQNYDTTSPQSSSVPASTKSVEKSQSPPATSTPQAATQEIVNNNESQKEAATSRTATTSPEQKGHIRRPSTVSVSSSNSAASTISDSDSEVSSNENDSGIESENQPEKDKCLEISRQFRTNLVCLYKSLEQMTEAGNYLIARYQSDVGGSSC